MAHILLLEDNPDMLTALTEVLELHNHLVTPGYTGRDGLSALSNGSIVDLIISDLTMPQMDGLSFLDEVRQHHDWSGIPFTIMSGHTADAQRALDAGADAFINKPFQMDELEDLLSRFL